MNLRKTIPSLAAVVLLSASGCAFITKLTSAGGADASAFTVDMERYDIKSIDLSSEAGPALCPGSSATVKIFAQAHDKKKNADTTLETTDPKGDAAAARGKMDITEFAMSARGGKIENGVFVADSDPFAALMGYDVKATYRVDKTKEATKHFGVQYSCFSQMGGSGPGGDSGSSGSQGSDGGGGGGGGGNGGPGGPGPKIAAYASIVQTPLFDKVGIIKLGDSEQVTLFDLTTGITVSARGGSGGYGGSGGSGGRGAENQGTGGAGGGGGDGGPGGDGGQVLLVLDDRYPELAQSVQVDVSGGGGGSGGRGGSGGSGAPSKKPCSDCSTIPAGANGPDGPSGNSSPISGRPGSSEVQSGDVTQMFAQLPPGVRLRKDARPAPVEAAPPPPTKPGKKKKTK